ncbi:5691_t:CDS:1, partial [Racocetra persica]
QIKSINCSTEPVLVQGRFVSANRNVKFRHAAGSTIYNEIAL